MVGTSADGVVEISFGRTALKTCYKAAFAWAVKSRGLRTAHFGGLHLQDRFDEVQPIGFKGDYGLQGTGRSGGGATRAGSR